MFVVSILPMYWCTYQHRQLTLLITHSPLTAWYLIARRMNFVAFECTQVIGMLTPQEELFPHEQSIKLQRKVLCYVEDHTTIVTKETLTQIPSHQHSHNQSCSKERITNVEVIQSIVQEEFPLQFL